MEGSYDAYNDVSLQRPFSHDIEVYANHAIYFPISPYYYKISTILHTSHNQILTSYIETHHIRLPIQISISQP